MNTEIQVGLKTALTAAHHLRWEYDRMIAETTDPEELAQLHAAEKSAWELHDFLLLLERKEHEV